MANLDRSGGGIGTNFVNFFSRKSAILNHKGGLPLVHFYDYSGTVRKKNGNLSSKTPRGLLWRKSRYTKTRSLTEQIKLSKKKTARLASKNNLTVNVGQVYDYPSVSIFYKRTRPTVTYYLPKSLTKIGPVLKKTGTARMLLGKTGPIGPAFSTPPLEKKTPPDSPLRIKEQTPPPRNPKSGYVTTTTFRPNSSKLGLKTKSNHNSPSPRFSKIPPTKAELGWGVRNLALENQKT